MSGSVVAHLVRKDLFLMRWPIAGTLAGGAAALALMPQGKFQAYLGGVLLICALVILNIVVALYAVAQERREKMAVFIFSLPVSPGQYTMAKVVAAGIAFVGPWLLLTAATMALIAGTALPDGLLPFWLAVLGYQLFYFCALLALTLVKDTSGWNAAGITVGNVSVNIVIPLLMAMPSIAAHIEGPRAVWTGDVLAVIGGELVLGALVLALAVRYHARRPDVV